MSTLKATNLQNASSATVNLALDTAGNATCAGTLAMASSFLRNRIINGGLAVDQRNAGASQTITAGSALAYTVDRWYAYCTGANVTGQRVTGAVANTYRYQFTGAASVTAIGFAQRIEALNSADLAGKTATLSVDLANSLLTTVTWTAYYANTADTFGTLASPTRTQIATGTFTVNSTVTRYSAQISIPAGATTGIEIVLSVGSQTSGTWTIGDPQLEEGAVATPFERRNCAQEVSFCSRYFQKLGGTTLADIVIQGYAVNASFNIASTTAIPQMRKEPIASVAGTWGNVNASALNFYISPTSVGLQAVSAAAGAVSVYTQNTTTYLTLNAEL
jgi:hypothetical protein